MQRNQRVMATILVLTTALISGVSNFIAKISVTVVKDPIVFTTLKNIVVAVFLIGIIVVWRRWREITSLAKPQWIKLIAIGVIGGSVPFALFFSGLAKTSAINASLIHKTLFLWVFLLAVPLLKERMSRLQWIGVGAIAASNLLIGGFTGFKLNAGELMILAATVLWAIENVIAKIALRDVSSAVVAGARMVLGSMLLAGFALWRGGAEAVFQLNVAQWSWTLLSSALLVGYVLTWYAALKRAPATYVATLLVPATLVTNVLSAIFITHALPVVQITNATLVTVGVLFIIFFPRKVIAKPRPSLVTEPER